MLDGGMHAKSGAMTGPFRINRTLIAVSGPDTRSFLNNLLTQDLERLEPRGVTYAALLSPQGKVSADMLAWAREDGSFILDADPARGEALLRRLSMYKLRAQAALSDVTSGWAVLVAEQPFDGARRDPRLPGLGWRKIDTQESAAACAEGAAAYEAMRLAQGVPDLARDAGPDEIFALEALLEELNGVAFDKGCFIGQENVSRMKRRATTRKKFCPLVFDGDALDFGTPVLASDAEIGTVRTGAPGRAIALLRLDRALAAPALTAGGRPVRLAPPPWLALPQREAP
ncbi:MAG: hypothetical protein R3C25_04835 [Hyphomonadaceae bacterium]